MSALSDALTAGITAQVKANSPEAKQEAEIISDYLIGNKVNRATQGANSIMEINSHLSNGNLDQSTSDNLKKLQAHIASLATS